MLYEIHMLKHYPATNLNRDDSGSPKSCVFGGVNRGRISSQCLKRSWRTSPYFQELVGKENIGIRTRELAQLVRQELTARGFREEDMDPWLQVIGGLISKKDSEDGKKKKLPILLYSKEDVLAVADGIQELLESGKKKADVKEIQSRMKKGSDLPVSLDIALFGRMVTSEVFRTVEASMQVAHGISTNKLNMESDYFTAMDDYLEGKQIQEAGHLSDTDYNSSCYYIYASLDSDGLRENLSGSDDAEQILQKAIPALIRTMAFSNPRGKQNSFAGHVLPSAVLVECKHRKIPVSYVNAYVDPARARGRKDLVADSVEKLVEECNTVSREYGIPVEKRVWFCTKKYAEYAPEGAVQCETFHQLVSEVEATMK